MYIMKNVYSNTSLLVEIDEKDREKLNISNKSNSNEPYEEIGSNYDGTFLYSFESDSSRKSTDASPWDEAYNFHNELLNRDIKAFVEPIHYDDSHKYEKEKAEKELKKEASATFLQNWPSPSDTYPNQFTWHLDDDHSQLASVRDQLMIEKPDAKIKIANIDTGYVPTHTALPLHLNPGKSFIKGEEGQPAIDRNVIRDSSFNEQDFHGTATMTLLAGKEVEENMAYGTGSRKIGGIPFADVFPYRVSEKVALASFMKNTIPFVKAIEEAISQKCEVITVSMGGLPTRAIAKVINKAYEAGITVVVSSGNNWMKGIGILAPKHVLYPARFDRVIAVTGACFNHEPYNFKVNTYSDVYREVDTDTYNREPMQGNYYPRSAMKTAIAAYSPNIAYCDFENQDETKPIIRKSGAGTSVAVPQVAAAVGLWLVENRDELIEKGYAGTWKQVEAVKQALFKGADKESFRDYEKYFGNGILKIKNTFENVPFPKDHTLVKAKKAKVSLWALKEFFQLVFIRGTEKSGFKRKKMRKPDEALIQMLSQEFLQVLEMDPVLVEEYFDLDLEGVDGEKLSNEKMFILFDKVATSSYSSSYLKELQRNL